MAQREKQLVKNTIIIFIGKFCTQFVSFVLIPIYTFFLSTDDYGYVDLIQTYISLFVPIFILRMDSGIFRFLIDERKNRQKQKEIVSSIFIFLGIQLVLLCVSFVIINHFWTLNYFVAIWLNIITFVIVNILLQLSRGLGNNIDYSIASVISGVSTIVLNILFIVFGRFNASYILYASSIANILASVYLMLRNHLYQLISVKNYNKEKMKDILKYTVPMIPDSLSWWVVNVSDRTILSIVIGTAANGIYAVSGKFSNILSSLFLIFNMSWQESAALYIDEEDKEKFFNDILEKTYKIFFTLCLVLLAIMYLIFRFFIGIEFSSAYFYIPPILIGNLYSAIANYIGAIYLAKKETKSVAKTTVFAAILNVIINLLLIQKIGIYAAAISTMISYIALALYRFIDVKKKFVDLKINNKLLGVSTLIYMIGTVIYYWNNMIVSSIFLVAVLVYSYLDNRNMLQLLWIKMKEKLNNGRRN